MEIVDRRIAGFIRGHHVMTLACNGGGQVWCANLFYSYIPEDNIFVFTTAEDTRHGEMMASGGGGVAASVVLETWRVGRLRGLQLQGTAWRPEGEMLSRAKSSYIKRFPYALAADLTLWVLRPTMMKLTDNRLGFGKKLLWSEG
jgi:uncharacterized protein YhbP (UPF0306 family)